MQKQFPKIKTFTSLVKNYIWDSNWNCLTSFTHSCGTKVCSNWWFCPRIFHYICSSIFTCFSRASSRVFEKKPSPFASIVLSLTNIDCSLLLLRQLPINNFSLLLVISPSIIHVPLRWRPTGQNEWVLCFLQTFFRKKADWNFPYVLKTEKLNFHN